MATHSRILAWRIPWTEEPGRLQSVGSQRVRRYCTVAHQASLSMGFSRQEYCSGLPCPPPADLTNPGIEPRSPVVPALQVDSLPLSHWGSPLTVLSMS